ncbi:hypothetical protein Tco_0591689 [Tanacetum coccineum]
MTTTSLMLGVIYDNDNSEKRFVAMDEVMKLSTDTLEKVRLRILQRLIDNNLNRINPSLTEEEVADLERMESTILNCLNTRDQMKRIESSINARQIGR